ncbi:MAG: hypothetical protein IAF38_16255, partial [Bacteroidia bacterium]|nr:hypothetical protein [Bacteroidia bacterium]
MRFLPLTILFFIGTFGFSQTNFNLGARSAAMGGASSTLHDVWSAQNNQAGLGYVDKIEVGAYYENRFLLKELSYSAFCAAIPVKKIGTFGVTMTSFGYNVFRQSKVGLGYGMKFG